jgi:hypothetical protein
MEFFMRSEEDEAFDELAKRQGAWGGGFKAKQAMAKARVEDDDDIQDYKKPWVNLTDDEVNNLAAGCHLGKSVQGAIYEAAAKLKEKNT